MTMITNLDLFGRSSSVGHPVIEERCVSFHKCHREALEEVLDGGLLFFAIVESIGSAELCHLGDRYGMPSAQGFSSERGEDNSLGIAGGPGFGHFPLMSHCEGIARGGGGPLYLCSLEWVDHRYVEGSILAAGPMGDEDVGWLCTLTGQEEAPLPGGPQAGANSCAVDGIPENVVPRDPLPLPSTIHGMVAKPVAVLPTCWTGTVASENWVAEAVSERGDKLRWAKEET